VQTSAVKPSQDKCLREGDHAEEAKEEDEGQRKDRRPD
jgi:hypothetical protein